MAQVYALYFKDESGIYIGCTRSGIAKRLREHRCLLRSSKHTCQPLQAAWDRNQSGLSIRVVAECADDLESRRAAELAAMDKADSSLMNDRFSFRPSEEARRKGVANAHIRPGNRWTPEANEKRRIAQLGKPKGHGAKVSAAKRAARASRLMGDDIV